MQPGAPLLQLLHADTTRAHLHLLVRNALASDNAVTPWKAFVTILIVKSSSFSFYLDVLEETTQKA